MIRFQVWDYFTDFASPKLNAFQVRFSVYDPKFIMPGQVTYNLNANIGIPKCAFQNNVGFKGEALKTKYQFIINNCRNSDSGIKFNFYYYKNEASYKQEIDNGHIVNKNLMKTDSIYNAYETVLPYGCSFILCSIVDSEGGITNKTQTVSLGHFSGAKSEYL